EAEDGLEATFLARRQRPGQQQQNGKEGHDEELAAADPVLRVRPGQARRSSESKNGEPRIGGRRRRERQEHGKREPEAKHQAITRPPPVSIGKGKTGKSSRRETGRLRKGTDDPMEAPFVRLREQCVVGRTDQREDVASSGQLAREIEESEAGGQN